MKLYEINDPFAADIEIRKWCAKFEIGPHEFKVNFDDMVSVDSNVQIVNQGFEQLPFRFNCAKRNFTIGNCANLKTLEGFPQSIKGYTTIRDCAELTSLSNAQTCKAFSDVILTRLPKLASLKYLPKLKSSLTVENCPLASRDLRNIHEYVKFTIQDEEGGRLWLDLDKVERGGLGILLIEGMKVLYDNRGFTDMPKQFIIISKYLYNDPTNIYECQAELIENGYEAFAEL